MLLNEIGESADVERALVKEPEVRGSQRDPPSPICSRAHKPVDAQCLYVSAKAPHLAAGNPPHPSTAQHPLLARHLQQEGEG